MDLLAPQACDLVLGDRQIEPMLTGEGRFLKVHLTVNGGEVAGLLQLAGDGRLALFERSHQTGDTGRMGKLAGKQRLP
jgi:ABC-type sugar transport system ATPase subunit